MIDYYIPFNGLDRQYRDLRTELLEVTDSVYRSGQLISGTNTVQFEKEIKRRAKRQYAISVNSGTTALILALKSLDWTKDRERNKILIPGLSFVATINSVLAAEYEPVFCDTDPVTGLIDLNKIPVSASDVAAVVAVNLFGDMVDYNQLRTWTSFFSDHRIPVIEDAAQSFGATFINKPSGSFGDISCLSFDPTKNLPNYGTGGMVLTDDHEVAEFCWNERDNGKASTHLWTGGNYKISEADCAQLLIKLKYFDAWQDRRKKIAEFYTQELAQSVTIPEIADNVGHARSRFVMHVDGRAALLDHLFYRNIETKIHYETPLHLHPVSFAFNADILDGAEEFSKSCVSLPLYPELTDLEVEYIAQQVTDYTG